MSHCRQYLSALFVTFSSEHGWHTLFVKLLRDDPGTESPVAILHTTSCPIFKMTAKPGGSEATRYSSPSLTLIPC